MRDTLLPGVKGPPYHLDHDARYEDDPEAQRFVAEHPSGGTLEEIGECFGVTRERVRQIEEVALRKLRHNAEVLSAVRVSGLGWGSASSAHAHNSERKTPLPRNRACAEEGQG